MQRDWWLAHAALRFADALKLAPGAAVIEHRHRERRTCICRGNAGKFEKRSGKLRCPLSQIGRRVGAALQDGKDIARFQRRSNATADRLIAVADKHTRRDPERLRHREQSVREFSCFLRGSYLRGTSHRHIENQMRRPGRDFLGHDGGDHLALRVQIKCALDPDQDIIRWTELDRAAPDDATSFVVHHALDRRRIECDRGQRLHHVRGARGRCDRA